MLNDIRLNTDSGYVSVLVLLDLSAAFDTVDHRILLHRLENWVALSGAVLNWLRSYFWFRVILLQLAAMNLSERP